MEIHRYIFSIPQLWAVIVFLVIPLILVVMLTLYTRTQLISTKSHQRFSDRNGLPSLSQLILIMIFGPAKWKDTMKRDRVADSGGPLASVIVDNFILQDHEKLQFAEIISGTKGKNDKSSDISDSTASFFVLPHVLGQMSFIYLVLHPIQPLNLLGSLHLRSYFEILDKNLLQNWCKGGTSSGYRYAIEAKYWGIIPLTPSPSAATTGDKKSSGKKGSELILTLELVAYRSGSDTSGVTVWRETMVIFSSKSVRDKSGTDIHGSANAARILNRCSRPNQEEISFTNLEHNIDIGKLFASADETWRFSMLSGDINPIHTSDILAKLFGQKRRIAHGAMIVAKALLQLEKVGGAKDESKIANGLAVAFKGPTPCNSEVAIHREDMSNSSTKDTSNFDLYCKGNSRPGICVRNYNLI